MDDDQYHRGQADRDKRDPKAPTWGLMLLYPVAAIAILVGQSVPGSNCEQAQWLLTLIGGIWVSWVSVRLLMRERHRWGVWVHYVFGALAFAGLVAVMFAITESNVHDGWLLKMGDPSECDAQDRASLEDGMKLYDDVVGDDYLTRRAARYLNIFVRRGCISIADLEEQKAAIERKRLEK